MGGTVSTGRDNDELIDNLVEGGYIKTLSVEKVHRAVDRANYYLPDGKRHAYADSAWKEGLLHISAPCIYAEVLEGLQLGPGMSFLNIGSGTGYLNTMAGLLIGSSGSNHGVELHESNVKYAFERLQEFLQNGLALRYFDFAPPVFLVANGLSLGTAFHHRYDRIYVGAACDDIDHVKDVIKFLKIGGQLVVPHNDSLVRFVRMGQSEVSRTTLMQCSFASLVLPVGDSHPEAAFAPRKL
ncbi:Protein-L-isoaspartate O-methyltransferase domain-containing protein 1 [Hypsibius exemplaris]|uniref:Protein-L-isoaspartate O-methyltransferase domain-containing protein 1 n=1 Tax=Hypsibius exemplaris TaxID=2072580 RepID=A0A9X6NKB7_HYPEX|nr:Protein-L-isoaspartate O-methyltransferase domain-containing protein 1 [Hypsibius exemplaris]